MIPTGIVIGLLIAVVSEVRRLDRRVLVFVLGGFACAFGAGIGISESSYLVAVAAVGVALVNIGVGAAVGVLSVSALRRR